MCEKNKQTNLKMWKFNAWWFYQWIQELQDSEFNLFGLTLCEGEGCTFIEICFHKIKFPAKLGGNWCWDVPLCFCCIIILTLIFLNELAYASTEKCWNRCWYFWPLDFQVEEQVYFDDVTGPWVWCIIGVTSSTYACASTTQSKSLYYVYVLLRNTQVTVPYFGYTIKEYYPFCKVNVFKKY